MQFFDESKQGSLEMWLVPLWGQGKCEKSCITCKGSNGSKEVNEAEACSQAPTGPIEDNLSEKKKK